MGGIGEKKYMIVLYVMICGKKPPLRVNKRQNEMSDNDRKEENEYDKQ